MAELVSRYPQLVEKDADVAVRTILDAMVNGLSQGQRIEIRGFGIFYVRYHPPRVGRNPKSGETIKIPAKHWLRFKGGKELRKRVNGK